MRKPQRAVIASITVVLLHISGVAALAADGSSAAAGLIEKTGVRGGLCLVIGAKDLALTNDLARSTFYVQVLQADEKLAAQWSATAAHSESRESISIRNSTFDAEHYNSDLFSLIIVQDTSGLQKSKLEDLCRILAPNGCAALSASPAGFADEAKALGMEATVCDGFAAIYRKPVKAVEWKLPLDTKWQAGPRSQIAGGTNGVCTGGGKLFYIEQMERNEGDLNDSAAVVFARDAYSGRTLWTWEMPGKYASHQGTALVATSKGRLFAKTGTGDVLCIDGETGKKLFDVTSKVHHEARVSLINDDLLLINDDVRSTETGKSLWKYPVFRYLPMQGTLIGDNMFFFDDKTIFARKLSGGGELWKIPLTDLPKPVRGLVRADNQLLVRMKGETKEELAVALLDSSNGKLLWTYTWKIHLGEAKELNADNVRSATIDGKLLLYYRTNQEKSYDDQLVCARLDMTSGKPEFEDKVNKDAGDFHGCFSELQLGDYIGWHDLWVNKKTFETSKPGAPHPACFFGSDSAYGMIYNFPSRKSGPISAVGPADTVFETAPGGKVLRKFGNASSSADPLPGDWPVFRGTQSGGNATAVSPGKDFVKVWEAKVGAGNTSFGLMSSLRTGLSQAVVAYGLAVVADIDGGRIVALDAATGKEKWIYPVGSRVDFPPTLYKGLCLVAARDGWVHCLDAATGQPVYRLLAAPRERLMAGREKIESRWPLDSDVFISNGVAYVSSANGGLAFRPESGEVVETKDAGAIALGKKVPGGRDFQLNYDTLLKGNSIPRTNEDNVVGFNRGKFGIRLDARVMAFDDTFTVAYQFMPVGEAWANKGKLLLKGIANDPAKPVWTSEPIELVVDDIVLAPQFAYCVGHYQRIKKDPELWVLSREDGKILNTIPVDGFPAFMGLSAAGKKIFVATREGKLLCYEGK